MTDEPTAATRKFRREINAGLISLLVLATCDRSPGPLYGYEIAKRLGRRNGGEPPMQPGALYPVLRSLEGLGLLSSRVRPSVSGPPRRYYRITAAGRRSLAEWRDLWSGTRRLVDLVLEEGA